MAQEYLPAPSNVRLADLMKEHNISQPELAKEIGCSKSTISRFISGAKGTLTHEQVLKIARLFNVSDVYKRQAIGCAVPAVEGIEGADGGQQHQHRQPAAPGQKGISPHAGACACLLYTSRCV